MVARWAPLAVILTIGVLLVVAPPAGLLLFLGSLAIAILRGETTRG